MKVTLGPAWKWLDFGGKRCCPPCKYEKNYCTGIKFFVVASWQHRSWRRFAVSDCASSWCCNKRPVCCCAGSNAEPTWQYGAGTCRAAVVAVSQHAVRRRPAQPRRPVGGNQGPATLCTARAGAPPVVWGPCRCQSLQQSVVWRCLPVSWLRRCLDAVATQRWMQSVW